MLRDPLNPEDSAQFRTQRRRVRNTYDLGLAQNLYQQGALGRGFARNQLDLTRQFEQMRQKTNWNFQGRGLGNSGLLTTAQGQVADQQAGAFGQLAGGHQDQLGAMQVAQSQIRDVRDNSLGDLYDAEAARRAAIAASIRTALGR